MEAQEQFQASAAAYNEKLQVFVAENETLRARVAELEAGAGEGGAASPSDAAVSDDVQALQSEIASLRAELEAAQSAGGAGGGSGDGAVSVAAAAGDSAGQDEATAGGDDEIASDFSSDVGELAPDEAAAAEKIDTLSRSLAEAQAAASAAAREAEELKEAMASLQSRASEEDSNNAANMLALQKELDEARAKTRDATTARDEAMVRV